MNEELSVENKGNRKGGEETMRVNEKIKLVQLDFRYCPGFLCLGDEEIISWLASSLSLLK